MKRVSDPIRVVVVEDSPTQRAFLRRSLEADGDIAVVGEAASALNAAAVVQHTRPDLVTMDLDIPGGGIRSIARIMERCPVPVLVLTGLAAGSRSAAGARALAAGAVGVLHKPLRWDGHEQEVLRNRVRMLQRVPAQGHRVAGANATAVGGPQITVPTPPRPGRTPVVVLGASTGGPKAVASILRELRPGDYPVVCVQHIDPEQVLGLARWLQASTGWPVRVAEEGDALVPGVVLVGRGGTHVLLDQDERIVLEADPDAVHAPSIDRTLTSMAQVCGSRVVACVLTGMGRDGADGMLAVHRAGGATFAQDEATSVVFGMPGAAVAAGAVRRLVPLEALPAVIENAVRSRR